MPPFYFTFVSFSSFRDCFFFVFSSSFCLLIWGWWLGFFDDSIFILMHESWDDDILIRIVCWIEYETQRNLKIFESTENKSERIWYKLLYFILFSFDDRPSWSPFIFSCIRYFLFWFALFWTKKRICSTLSCLLLKRKKARRNDSSTWKRFTALIKKKETKTKPTRTTTNIYI